MSDTTYNGWKNYATWRVNLEIISDYVSQTVYDELEIAQEWLDMQTYDLTETLKEYADDVISNWGNLQESLALDYARAFLEYVDWYEIAEHAQTEAKEALEYAKA